MDTTFNQLAQYATPPTGAGVRGRLAAALFCRTLVCIAVLSAVVSCGESSCPTGSMKVGGRCIDESALQGDGGPGLADAASGDGADSPDARVAPPLDAALDAASDADACVDCCEPGYVIESGSCVRNPCLPSASEPALCDANAACTYEGGGIASCACKEGYLGDGVSCACAEGYADCDADQANGCEQSIDTDASHCGACGFACAEGLDCKSAACEPRATHIGMGIVASLFTVGSGQVFGAGAGRIIGPATQASPTALLHGKVVRAHPYQDHACALRPDATGAVCWGDNTMKQLGSSNTSDTSFETATPGRAVCAGERHGCFVGQAGAVHCWGQGYLGEYGDGVTRTRTWTGRGFDEASSSPVSQVSGALDVVCGRLINCALTSVGRVQCWGMEGSTPYPAEYVRDADSNRLEDAVALSAGQHHVCAVRSDASLVCWGDSADGRLGAGATVPVGRNHFVTPAVSGVKAVACGSAHTCVLLADGAVRCWGSGANGALGAGDTASQSVPTAPLLPPASVATAIFSGPSAAGTCATLTTGQVYCWGYNAYGQLGVGDTSAYEVEPVEVAAWP